MLPIWETIKSKTLIMLAIKTQIFSLLANFKRNYSLQVTGPSPTASMYVPGLSTPKASGLFPCWAADLKGLWTPMRNICFHLLPQNMSYYLEFYHESLQWYSTIISYAILYHGIRWQNPLRESIIKVRNQEQGKRKYRHANPM